MGLRLIGGLVAVRTYTSAIVNACERWCWCRWMREGGADLVLLAVVMARGRLVDYDGVKVGLGEEEDNE